MVIVYSHHDQSQTATICSVILVVLIPILLSRALEIYPYYTLIIYHNLVMIPYITHHQMKIEMQFGILIMTMFCFWNKKQGTRRTV